MLVSTPTCVALHCHASQSGLQLTSVAIDKGRNASHIKFCKFWLLSFANPPFLLHIVTTVMPSVLLVVLSLLGLYFVHTLSEFRMAVRSVG